MNGSVRYKPRNVVATFTDKYGEERIIHTPQGKNSRGLRLLTNGNTPAALLNRAAARLIGQKIKARREAIGMTMDELGTKAGLKAIIPKNYVWGIENAIRDNGIRIGTLYALAAALGCEPASIMPSVAEVKELAEVSETTITALRG